MIRESGPPVHHLCELGCGHHGEVLRIARDLAAKRLWHPESGQIAARLDVPADAFLDPALGHRWLVWPLERILDASTHEVLGYTLPYVDTPRTFVPLGSVMDAEGRRAANLSVSSRWTLRVALHVATATWWAEARGLHVVDLNPRNVLIDRRTGLATVLDPEGVSVDGGVPNMDGDLKPPEMIAGRGATAEGAARWSLAVTVTTLLLQGRHPFGGRAHAPVQGERSPQANVAIGWSRLLDPEAGTPLPDGLVDTVPTAALALAERCFGVGREDPLARPSVEEWVYALAAADDVLVPCEISSQHWRPQSEPCAWCAMQLAHGEDVYDAGGRFARV